MTTKRYILSGTLYYILMGSMENATEVDKKLRFLKSTERAASRDCFREEGTSK